MSNHEFASEHLEIGWQTYVEALLNEKQRALDAALAAQKEAVTKAETATERIAARAIADQETMREEVAERLTALRRELEAATAAQKEAVLKAEEATERRFESVNEWRGQSADRERSQAAERAAMVGSFVLREVAETQFAGLETRLSTLQSQVDMQTGQREGALSARTVMFAVAMIVVALLAVAATLIARLA
jgi:hypothetical protein